MSIPKFYQLPQAIEKAMSMRLTMSNDMVSILNKDQKVIESCKKFISNEGNISLTMDYEFAKNYKAGNIHREKAMEIGKQIDDLQEEINKINNQSKNLELDIASANDSIFRKRASKFIGLAIIIYVIWHFKLEIVTLTASILEY